MSAQTASRPLVVHIDDNEGDLELGQQAVEVCYGAKVEYRGIARATTALEVLATLTEPGAPPIALIIVDVNLPRINGWEIVAYIKSNATLRHARLVMMSGSNSARDIARARAVAVDYRVKPATFSALCTLLCDLIGPDFR